MKMTLVEEIKSLTRGLLEDVRGEVDKAEKLEDIAQSLQAFTYLGDLMLNQNIRKLEECIRLYYRLDYKKMADLLNEGEG